MAIDAHMRAYALSRRLGANDRLANVRNILAASPRSRERDTDRNGRFFERQPLGVGERGPR